MPNESLPEWEALLSSAAHLQRILPEAVLVGGTAAASFAHHRVSMDHDHSPGDLRSRFDDVLAALESVDIMGTGFLKVVPATETATVL